MKKFQYEIVKFPVTQIAESIIKVLDAFGEAGWELVSFMVDSDGCTKVAVLKRAFGS